MQRFMRWFRSEHLPDDLRAIAVPIEQLACQLHANLPDSAEKSAGLRKLIEAKDCFVRARIEAREQDALAPR